MILRQRIYKTECGLSTSSDAWISTYVDTLVSSLNKEEATIAPVTDIEVGVKPPSHLSTCGGRT